MTSRILFYNDAREFGGHEQMTVSAAHFMAKQPHLDIHFAYYDGNARLRQSLCGTRGSESPTLHPLPLRSTGLSGLRGLYWMSRMPLVERFVRDVAPDTVVVSQGNIEMGVPGLLASKRAGLPTISYIPMAHRIAASGAFTLPGRDILDRWLYRVPDKFVTIAESVRSMLRERGARSEISVVHNGIDPACCPARTRPENRLRCGFSPAEYVVAVVGRILFAQKGQDLLVRAVTAHGGEMPGVHFCVVGDGADEPLLRRMVREGRLERMISILPWNDNLALLYSGIDMLLIPSRFEGVPLVMLEAMYYELPIVASDVDGMAEILPREWLFRSGDAGSLARTISRVRFADNSQLVANNKKRVLSEFSLRKFQELFCREVTEGIQRQRASPD